MLKHFHLPHPSWSTTLTVASFPSHLCRIHRISFASSPCPQHSAFHTTTPTHAVIMKLKNRTSSLSRNTLSRGGGTRSRLKAAAALKQQQDAAAAERQRIDELTAFEEKAIRLEAEAAEIQTVETGKY